MKNIWTIIVIPAGIAWVLCALFVLGCPKATVHPGSLNAFDSATYDALRSAQASIEQASKEIVNYPNLKPQLNAVIDVYNLAEKSYKAYHEAVAAGKATDQSGLATQMDGLKAAVASILAKLHPVKAPPGILILGWL